MNTYFAFMGIHPWIGLFLTAMALTTLGDLILKCWSRTLRCLNIRKHGWPPEHCDADGDFRPEPKAERVDSSGKPMPAPTEYRPGA